MNYDNIDNYLRAALIVCAACVIVISIWAYCARNSRLSLAICGGVLLLGLLLAVPALSNLLVIAASDKAISEIQQRALQAKITGHLVLFSVILGSVGANFLTSAVTKPR